MKLYRVLLRGMTNSSISINHGSPYVVAEDPTAAYKRVKDYLDKKDIGFRQDRALYKIELLAETGDYPDCKEQLFLPEEKP